MATVEHSESADDKNGLARRSTQDQPITHMETTMTYAFPTRTILTTLGALAITLASLQAGFAKDASGDELWAINPIHSKLSLGLNTMTVERTGPRDVNTKSSPGTGFLVLSDGKVYLATSGANPDASKGIPDAAYSNWNNMALTQIGDHAKGTVLCNTGIRCQSGDLPHQMTITFMGVGDMERANDMIAANRH